MKLIDLVYDIHIYIYVHFHIYLSGQYVSIYSSLKYYLHLVLELNRLDPGPRYGSEMNLEQWTVWF